MSFMKTPSPLAVDYYIDPAYFERDKIDIFYRSWECVCHVSEVAEPGDFVTHDLVDEKVLVLRDQAGKLSAFFNLCRHRGYPLLEGSGNTGKRMVCPYHAWCYDLSGSVVSVPGASAAESEACAGLKLRQVRVEEFCGFVFVNLDPQAASMQSLFADVDAVVRSFHPDPGLLRFVSETSIVHDCNWKISIENYNECYHCPTIHASSLTRGVLDMDGYSIIPHGQTIWHQGRAQTASRKQYDYDVGHGERGGDYGSYWLWPKVSFCCYPGGYFSIRQWLPINWRKTVYRYRWFSDGSLSDDKVRELMATHRRTTGAEDEAVVSRVQQGMESRAFEPGPYIVGDGDSAISEIGVRHFHQLYRAAIGQTEDGGKTV